MLDTRRRMCGLVGVDVMEDSGKREKGNRMRVNTRCSCMHMKGVLCENICKYNLVAPYGNCTELSLKEIVKVWGSRMKLRCQMRLSDRTEQCQPSLAKMGKTPIV